VKHLLTTALTAWSLLLSLAFTGHAAAEGTPDVIDKIRVVIPAGWEVGQQAGTPNLTVTRKAAIPPGDLAFKPIPSSPAFGEGSASHAKTNGIRVWFTLEPVGACSAAEYEQRKARNAEIQALLEPLRKKIEQIPGTPGVKPGLLSRTARNEEEKSWLAEYANVSSKRQILPTHHVDGKGFLVTLVKSYYGASITVANVRDEIDAVRMAIEKVLVPYESPANGDPAEANNPPDWTLSPLVQVCRKARPPYAVASLPPLELRKANQVPQPGDGK